MHVGEFIAKWKKAELKESAAAQEHFIDFREIDLLAAQGFRNTLISYMRQREK